MNEPQRTTEGWLINCRWCGYAMARLGIEDFDTAGRGIHRGCRIVESAFERRRRLGFDVVDRFALCNCRECRA